MKWLLALGAVQRQENLSARLLLLFPAQLETIKDISLDAAQNTTLSEVCTKIKCHKKGQLEVHHGWFSNMGFWWD